MQEPFYVETRWPALLQETSGAVLGPTGLSLYVVSAMVGARGRTYLLPASGQFEPLAVHSGNGYKSPGRVSPAILLRVRFKMRELLLPFAITAAVTTLSTT